MNQCTSPGTEDGNSPGWGQDAILYTQVIVSEIRPPAASAAVARSVTYLPAAAVKAAR